MVCAALIVAACTTDPEQPAPSPGAGGPGSLAGVCPDPVVIQTGWWPQAERGGLYHLLGAEPTIDAERKRVSGPLVAAGTDTGVQVEIRAGGPAIGFQLGSALLRTDDEIMLAEVITDEAVQVSTTAPVRSVVAFLDIFPIMIMWDPETYPEFETIVDLGQSDTTVLVFGEVPYIEYLVGLDILQPEQLDGSYDGTPSRWVAEDGAIAQTGMASYDPYVYEHDLAPWNQPVRFQMIYELGYQAYSTLAIRPDQQDELAPCLELLVPIIQQSLVDYSQDPDATNDLLVQLVDEYGGFPYSPGTPVFAVEQMRSLGIIGNGHNATVGDFDPDRVAEMIGVVTPIYTAQGADIRPDLTAEDIATNEFIDPDIGLP